MDCVDKAKFRTFECGTPARRCQLPTVTRALQGKDPSGGAIGSTSTKPGPLDQPWWDLVLDALPGGERQRPCFVPTCRQTKAAFRVWTGLVVHKVDPSSITSDGNKVQATCYCRPCGYV